MASTRKIAMTATQPVSVEQTEYVERPEGHVGYDVAGEGPLVVLVPGMGDLRAAYHFLAPALRDAGYRVACTDLRGHGDSDATFSSYGDPETAGDVLALIEQLNSSAVIVGNSMGAGAAVFAATEQPNLVRGLVLLGPFVRNGKTNALQRLTLRVAMARPWAAISWKAYMPKLYAGRRPSDFYEYRDRVVASLRRPSYAKAFSITTRTSHDPAEARLADVSQPTLVVMGEQDPPARRSPLDRASPARRGRDGPRSRALPPIATTRRDSRLRPDVSRNDALARPPQLDRSCFHDGTSISTRSAAHLESARIAGLRELERRPGQRPCRGSEQPSGSVLNQHSPLVAAVARVPGSHPAAGAKGAKAGAVRPTSSRPARTATSGGSACSGSPGLRQRRSCRPCRRS